MILIFIVLVGLAVAIGAAGFMLDRSGESGRKIAARLRMLGFAPEQAASVSIAREDRARRMPGLDEALRALRMGPKLELLLYQAGMSITPGALVALVAGFGLGGYAGGLFAFHRLFPAIGLAVLLAPLPLLYVRVRKAKRMKAFSREFPDALDLLVSGLRAGLSFTAAMQIVAEESPEPVRGEFAITIGEQGLGIELREALIHLTERVDVLDLKFFVTAVLLQHQTGGNLAEVLSNSAVLIRERFKVLGDIATFTAQGKMTAVILAALPLVVALIMFMSAPNYFIPMITTDEGRHALMFAGGLQVLGMVVIHRIVNIKV